MTRRGGHIDLVHELLDHELVDVNGTPCGVIDDIELTGGIGERLRVTALLIGPGASGPRLPRLVAWAVARLFSTRRVRVPWDQIDTISERIVLRTTGASLGLGKLDRKVGRWLARLPGSDKAH
jgi:sporulation protein YlmC with PRC-barrel domain